jgi:signal transduction histidine kinase
MMFKKKNQLIALIPVISLAVAGIYAIVQEAQRSFEAEASFLETKAVYAAELISARVHDIGSSMLSRIAEEPFENRVNSLKELVDTDPFVRSAFLWQRNQYSARGKIVWSSTESSREAFFSNEGKRMAEFTSKNLQDNVEGEEGHLIKKNVFPSRECYWVSQTANTGRRIACWRCISTNLVCLVEFETMAVLARIPGWLVEFGVNTPSLSGNQGLVAEVRDVTQGVLCPSSIKLRGAYFGESSLKGIMMPEWSINVGWSKGDEVVDSRVIRVLIGAGSLLVLCVAWISVIFLRLAKAASEAQKESMEKTTFVDNVSHELKTPLTSIMLYTEMLQSGQMKSKEAMDKSLDVISSECSRLLRMVENLLDFTRLEKKRRKFKVEKIEVVRFVADTIDLVRDRFQDNGITFDARGEVFALGEYDAVRQILLNVLDNAAKYASAYGTVDVAVFKDDDKVILSIKDRGPGISRESLKNVFKRFWREDDSTTSEISGNGLGLSIALHLAKGMGGDLRVLSEEGRGCIFTLELKGVCDG